MSRLSSVGCSQFTRIRVGKLRVGAVLPSPIYDDRDDRDVLLLASGTCITRELLQRLHARNITNVRITAVDAARVSAPDPHAVLPGSTRVPRQATVKRQPASPLNEEAPTKTNLVQSGSQSWRITNKSFIHKLRRHGRTNYETATQVEFVADHRQSVAQLASMFKSLSEGTLKNADGVISMTNQAMAKIARDSDLFVSLGISPAADEYPARHGLQTAMLALAIGTSLGLTPEALEELGIGCLIHDVGMLKLANRVFELDRVLDDVEFLEITKHPLLTFDLIKPLQAISTGSRMVAYQMHERYDGSGYPRQRRGCQIHHLARIAAVADVYVALVSPRPHRPGQLPYSAVEHLIQGARSQLFDPSAVRGLLKTISLFPIGSFVEMSDGRVGRVVRANGDAYARPVVELWHRENTMAEGVLVDLTEEPNLSVAKPLPELDIVVPVDPSADWGDLDAT